MAWQDREKELNNLLAVHQKVGEICVIWAALDFQIDEIISDLLDIGEAQTAAVMTGQDFSRKCETVRRLLTLGGPSPDWVTEMDGLMRELCDDLNRKRNRYVHDMWSFDVEAIVRIERRAIAQRPQSRQTTTLLFNKEVPEALSEISSVCVRAGEILVRLDDLKPLLVQWLIAERDKLR